MILNWMVLDLLVCIIEQISLAVLRLISILGWCKDIYYVRKDELKGKLKRKARNSFIRAPRVHWEGREIKRGWFPESSTKGKPASVHSSRCVKASLDDFIIFTRRFIRPFSFSGKRYKAKGCISLSTWFHDFLPADGSIRITCAKVCGRKSQLSIGIFGHSEFYVNTSCKGISGGRNCWKGLTCCDCSCFRILVDGSLHHRFANIFDTLIFPPIRSFPKFEL